MSVQTELVYFESNEEMEVEDPTCIHSYRLTFLQNLRNF